MRNRLIVAGAIALATSAVLVKRRSDRAERNYPPRGSFIKCDGVNLHYVERGSGPPVVFLHGNGGTVVDLLISGVLDEAGQSYRAIAIDRPGFGYSDRPRSRSWSVSDQAALLQKCFVALGIDRPIVVGHSFGSSVAAALALDFPQDVSGLVLVSGYYYPTVRADTALYAPAATPFLGDLLRHTIGPYVGDFVGPALIEKMFAPQPVPAWFSHQFPLELALRPSQIRAFAEDSEHMLGSAMSLFSRYREISCPVGIMTGDADRIVNYRHQSMRLREEIEGSELDRLSGIGHMVHHHDPSRLVKMIEHISSQAKGRLSLAAKIGLSAS